MPSDPQQQLTVVFEGLDEDSQDLRLRAFAKKLDDIKDALRLSAEAIDAPAKQQDYLIVEIRKESPIAMTMNPVDPVWGGAAVNGLLRGLETLRAASVLPRDFPDQLFDAAKRLLGGQGSIFKRLGLRVGDGVPGGIAAEVDAELGDSMATIERADVMAYGSIKGAIERFNSHSGANYFYLYPRFGGGIKCDFPVNLLPKAAEAVTRNATISGMLKYHSARPLPYLCTVRDILVHPKDSDLPTLGSLYGVAPQMTGGLDTFDFIRKVRRGWQS